MLEDVRVLELGEHASVAGRLLAASGANVSLYPGRPTGDTSLREWRARFKRVVDAIPDAGAVDLVLDGRPAGAEPIGFGPATPVVRVTPLGEAGPWSRWVVDDADVQGLS